jgi:hypothetical protein
VFSRLLPEVRGSPLLAPGAGPDGIERAVMAGAGAVGLAWPASSDAVRYAHDAGLSVMVYTLNQPAGSVTPAPPGWT